MTPALQPQPTPVLLDDLTAAQRDAVTHERGPLLIIAGAGTGKTTVIARRIAWLLATQRAQPPEILALTFSEKAAAEMEERIDLLVPYGYLDIGVSTFHAFGDRLLREHALRVGLTPNFRVLSQAEQHVMLRRWLFDLPLAEFRPPHDPTRYLGALAAVFARAKDEAADPEEFLAHARLAGGGAGRIQELAAVYAAYQHRLQDADLADFGDLVLLAIRLLEQAPELRAAVQGRVRYLLVDEFQDTNYAQFRLLQLLAGEGTQVTVVGDDDQSIYKWRGAAISNVVKFLDLHPDVRTVVLTENFRSAQGILDCAYRLIRHNDPDRLEVRQGIDKRLVARAACPPAEPRIHALDTASSEADWVASTIREAIASGRRRPSDIAILVRSNRDADLFLRALNVAGVPWQFSGASGLLAREESKMLLSCLRALADPDDSLSWYHVASSALYRCPMGDLSAVLARASRRHASFRAVAERLDDPAWGEPLTEEGLRRIGELLADIGRLLERSRTRTAGQVLYEWLADRGFLAALARSERPEELLALQTVGRFFHHLRRMEDLVGGSLPELMHHLELFQAMGQEPVEEDDAWADRVQVLTLHKAKGLEFPVVYMVGLVQGRFPTPQRPDPIELPEPLIKDILPLGDYHLQEERRLFYVGMTRAKEELFLTCAYDYGGKSVRKTSQFVLEAMDLPTPSPQARRASARELIERSSVRQPLPVAARPQAVLRLDPHGVDDYMTCPLKYRYSHLLRIPVMRHHLVVYGAAIHKAIEALFTRRLQGQELSEAELLEVFEQAWRSEGFLTRQHEEARLAQGRATLRRWFAAQQAAPEFPTLVEEKFRFPLDDLLVVGRWDRVDCRGDEVVIVDYKSSDVREQREADRRTRESLQLLVYALAWRTLHGQVPAVELRFLETGLTGRARLTDDDLERARAALREAAAGIRAHAFPAKPQEFACRWCAFQTVCPSAFQPTAVS